MANATFTESELDGAIIDSMTAMWNGLRAEGEAIHTANDTRECIATEAKTNALFKTLRTQVLRDIAEMVEVAKAELAEETA